MIVILIVGMVDRRDLLRYADQTARVRRGLTGF